MANLNDLLAKQSQLMGPIARALPNFKKLGTANMSLAVTRRRYEALKDNFAKCQQLDAEIWAQADEKARNTQPYFTEGQFLECEERFNEAADFMVEVLEKAVRADAAYSAQTPVNPPERNPCAYVGSVNPQPRYNTQSLLRSPPRKIIIPRSQPLRALNEWPHITSLNLADNDPFSPDPVDILIGADLYGMLFLNGVRKGAINQPSAQNTALGWIISGPVTPSSISSHVHLHDTTIEQTLDADLRRSWQIEELPEQAILSPEEQLCESHFQTTHSRTPEGRYMVRLPFKTDSVVDLGASKPVATSRLLLLERRLLRDPAQSTAYRQFLAEYLELHHMEPAAPIKNPNSGHYYIPHHAVVKRDSDTTPLRVVFNASCATSTGKSLNDCLLIGPKLQNDLPSVLLRWRHFQYVYTADSAKMYRQILLDPRDRDYKRILWRSTFSDPISEFRLCTVTYGTSPTAYLAQRVIKQLVEDEGSPFPLAIPVLNNQSYVDDFLFGAEDQQLAIQTRDEVVALLNKGGFHLRKWASNCSSLLEGIERSGHGLACEKSIDADEHLKILGVSWHPGTDTVKFQVNMPTTCATTKRGILSVIARLFDPLGLVTPVTITAKIMMQNLWLLQCDWDETVPSTLLREWQRYYDALHTLRNISIPRWNYQNSRSLQYSLHGFADASNHAYAAVVYSRVINPNGSVSMTLLMAKAKVAPVKTVSIPRLELLAAYLLSRLMVVIRSALQFDNIPCHCWTDSTIVLSWLRQQPSQWQTFVANRVSKIQNALPDVTWLHVPTRENPADCASRALSASELQNHSRHVRPAERLAFTRNPARQNYHPSSHSA
ncbi:uncharacterized protein LOC105664063 [Megachile rotundata]|uniref:uncharacterized protein LOC105664063 n=1 Tax=Megachile rotundata TaxID=143995 RepID=UPI003FD678F5